MLKVGDRVKVVIPRGDVTGANIVKQFNGKVTVVKEVKTYYKSKSSLGRTFALAGCKSDWGIDYEFVEEWLVPLDEEVEE